MLEEEERPIRTRKEETSFVVCSIYSLGRNVRNVSLGREYGRKDGAIHKGRPHWEAEGVAQKQT